MHARRMYRGGGLLAAMLGLCLATGSARAEEATLDRELLTQSKAIIKALREKGCRNVGVLKFQVQKGKQPASDNVGTLNMTAAGRLEMALLLANPNAEADQIGIVRNASATAATIDGANHLTAEGRERLFTAMYPLAWGDRLVTPDTFLTGKITVAENLRDMEVEILAFDSSGSEPQPIVPPFKALVAADLLGELGEGFVLRGAFDAGKMQMASAAAVASAIDVKATKAKHPLGDASAPVSLEIQYDGRAVPVDIQNGEARIPEPQPGQAVSFVLRYKKPTADRMAAVLKINGENTLFHERLPDLQCRKWVLSSKKPAVTIRGFQTDEKRAAPFVVLSTPASREQEVNYGADVGTITLAVFREKAPDEASLPPALDDFSEDLTALAGGRFPEKAPANLAALKFQIRQDGSRSGPRGLIVDDGARAASAINTIPFEENPTPVMVAVIRYYKP